MFYKSPFILKSWLLRWNDTKDSLFSDLTKFEKKKTASQYRNVWPIGHDKDALILNASDLKNNTKGDVTKKLAIWPIKLGQPDPTPHRETNL